MRIATIGSDPLLSRRRRVLAELGQVDLVDRTAAVLSAVAEAAGLDVLFIGVARADRFEIAARAARSGTHVFIEWPPATSIRECAALVRLAEESGVECGVSRPLRFSPLLEPSGGDFRARAVSLSFGGGVGHSNDAGDLEGISPHPPYPDMSRLIADAVDLSCALVKSSSVRRIDAESVRNDSAQPEATLFSLRFHSGAYVQAVVRMNGLAVDPEVYAASSSIRVDGRLTTGEEVLRRETESFLEAVDAGRPAPVSALDALHTMRIVERLQGVLR